MSKPMNDMLDSLYAKECLFPRACSWYVVNLISKDSGEGLTYKVIKETLLDNLGDRLDFSFGPEISLKDVLERFVEEGIIEEFDSRYMITNKGRRDLKDKINLVRRFVKES